MKTETLSIDLLVTDADTQSRVAISEDTVEEYAEKIADAKSWPLSELDVFHDGSRYMVADGFHRTLAAHKAKRASVPCRIHKGTAKDARIFGMTANDRHGLRMSRADKRHCVEWLLDNGGKLAQTEIAKKAGVSRRTVQFVISARKEKAQIALSDNQPKAQVGPQKSPASLAKVSAEAAQAAKQLGTNSQTTAQVPADEGEQSRALSDSAAPPATPDWRPERSRAKKTVEALMRSLNDLHDLKPISFRDDALDCCREIITQLDSVK